MVFLNGIIGILWKQDWPSSLMPQFHQHIGVLHLLLRCFLLIDAHCHIGKFESIPSAVPDTTKLLKAPCLWMFMLSLDKTLQDKYPLCLFLGYSLTQNAYICPDPSSNRHYISRHVQFIETSFPFQTLFNPTKEKPASPLTD